MRLTPRGGRDAVDGWGADDAGRAYLKARVTAGPTEGEANAALVHLLARTLGLPRSTVRIAAGQTARLKQVQIDHPDAAALIDAAFGRPASP